PNALALAPGDRFLAAGEQTFSEPAALDLPRQIRFWHLTTGQQVAALSGHDCDVSALIFSPDGGTLISAHHDSTVIAWEVPAAARRRGFDRLPLPMDEATELWRQLGSADAKE